MSRFESPKMNVNVGAAKAIAILCQRAPRPRENRTLVERLVVGAVWFDRPPTFVAARINGLAAASSRRRVAKPSAL